MGFLNDSPLFFWFHEKKECQNGKKANNPVETLPRQSFDQAGKFVGTEETVNTKKENPQEGQANQDFEHGKRVKQSIL